MEYGLSPLQQQQRRKSCLCWHPQLHFDARSGIDTNFQHFFKECSQVLCHCWCQHSSLHNWRNLPSIQGGAKCWQCGHLHPTERHRFRGRPGILFKQYLTMATGQVFFSSNTWQWPGICLKPFRLTVLPGILLNTWQYPDNIELPYFSYISLVKYSKHL